MHILLLFLASAPLHVTTYHKPVISTEKPAKHKLRVQDKGNSLVDGRVHEAIWAIAGVLHDEAQRQNLEKTKKGVAWFEIA